MNRTKRYFTNAWKGVLESVKKDGLYAYLLAALLICIPLNYAYGSISTAAFVFYALIKIRKGSFQFRKTLLLPILFYALMVLSLLWTVNTELTLSGLRKEAYLLAVPLAFFFVPPITREAASRIFRIYSWGMVAFAVVSVIKAIIRYIPSGDEKVFFYHELVTKDVNAIYVAVFASLGFFRFFYLKQRTALDNIALWILAVFIVLLSSKSIIFIDFLLVCCFYIYFAEIKNSVKWLTVSSVAIFLSCSLMFVPEIRERFLIEYETAFVDNTLNRDFNEKGVEIYNISLRQAWNNEHFQQNNYFPGTALRVYQVRIFGEMLREDNIFFTGYGLEASQQKIEDKTKEHNLYQGYGEFNFHNEYIQIFAEIGIFGLLILVSMLIVNLRRAFTDKNFLHIVFAVTMLVLFLTESFFCRQRGLIFFITLYCIFIAIERQKTAETN